MVRAKFNVDEIRRVMGSIGEVGDDGKVTWKMGELRTVVMSPVYGHGDPEHENTKFWQATPSGKLELGCANLKAAEMFDIGEQYYIDFTKAE